MDIAHCEKLSKRIFTQVAVRGGRVGGREGGVGGREGG